MNSLFLSSSNSFSSTQNHYAFASNCCFSKWHGVWFSNWIPWFWVWCLEYSEFPPPQKLGLFCKGPPWVPERVPGFPLPICLHPGRCWRSLLAIVAWMAFPVPWGPSYSADWVAWGFFWVLRRTCFSNDFPTCMLCNFTCFSWARQLFSRRTRVPWSAQVNSPFTEHHHQDCSRLVETFSFPPSYFPNHQAWQARWWGEWRTG